MRHQKCGCSFLQSLGSSHISVSIFASTVFISLCVGVHLLLLECHQCVIWCVEAPYELLARFLIPLHLAKSVCTELQPLHDSGIIIMFIYLLISGSWTLFLVLLLTEWSSMDNSSRMRFIHLGGENESERVGGNQNTWDTLRCTKCF